MEPSGLDTKIASLIWAVRVMLLVTVFSEGVAASAVPANAPANPSAIRILFSFI
ncbi:hypothetical protein D3C77_787870 [compost metagenome]